MIKNIHADKCLLQNKSEEEKERLFGKMKGTIHILEDLLAPIDEIWNASHE